MRYYSTTTYTATANTPIGKIEKSFEFGRHESEYRIKRRAQEVIAWQNGQKVLGTCEVEILKITKK